MAGTNFYYQLGFHQKTKANKMFRTWIFKHKTTQLKLFRHGNKNNTENVDINSCFFLTLFRILDLTNFHWHKSKSHKQVYAVF